MARPGPGGRVRVTPPAGTQRFGYPEVNLVIMAEAWIGSQDPWEAI